MFILSFTQVSVDIIVDKTVSLWITLYNRWIVFSLFNRFPTVPNYYEVRVVFVNLQVDSV